jgi:hypothetical protein
MRCFLVFFPGVVEWCFWWGFCEFGCAKRGFFRGKRGGNVVNYMAGSGSKFAGKNGTGHWDLFLSDC